MVNIPGACLSGATLITGPQHTKKPQGMDIGHFLLVLNPAPFRRDGIPVAPNQRGKLSAIADACDAPWLL